MRYTVAVHESLIAQANNLAAIIGMGPEDMQTFGEPGHQDAGGHRYAVASGLVPPDFILAAQAPLTAPPWGADMAAAAVAQAAIHIGDAAQTATCLAAPDRITAIVHDDPHHALALMGLGRGPD